MLFYFFNFSQCVVCMFGHKKSSLQREILVVKKKIPFQEL